MIHNTCEANGEEKS